METELKNTYDIVTDVMLDLIKSSRIRADDNDAINNVNFSNSADSDNRYSKEEI